MEQASDQKSAACSKCQQGHCSGSAVRQDEQPFRTTGGASDETMGWVFETVFREDGAFRSFGIQLRPLLRRRRGRPFDAVRPVTDRCSSRALCFLLCGGAAGAESRGGRTGQRRRWSSYRRRRIWIGAVAGHEGHTLGVHARGGQCGHATIVGADSRSSSCNEYSSPNKSKEEGSSTQGWSHSQSLCAHGSPSNELGTGESPCTISPSRCWRSPGSTTGRSPRSKPGGDAATTGLEPEGSQAEGYQPCVETCTRPAVRGRRGRGECRSPAWRIWIGRHWGPYAGCLASADFHCGAVGYRQEEEGRYFEAGAGFGWCFRVSRGELNFTRQWEEECSSSKMSEEHLPGAAWGDIECHREVDVWRSELDDVGAGATALGAQCPSMGRIPFKDLQLQDLSPCQLGHRRGVRFTHCRRCLESTSSLLLDVIAIRSGQHRQRQLGFRLGSQYGRSPSFQCSGQSPRAVLGGRRTAVLSPARLPLGGDNPRVSPRARRLCGSPTQHREAISSEGQRRRSRRPGSQEEGKSKSKEQSELKLAAGCMTGNKGPTRTTTSLDASSTQPLKQPVSDASTVRIPAFLNSLPRWLLKIPCNLQVFLRSILKSPGRSDDTTSMSRSTWPMPLPFPEVFCSGMKCDDSRPHVKRLVSLQVLILDWFVLGRPMSAPQYLGIGNKLTARQWSVVRRFEDLVLDGNSPQFIDAGDMGRSASKNQSHEECLETLCRAASMVHVFDNYGGGSNSRPGSFDDEWFRCGCLVGRINKSNPCSAKPIVASRITVPECPRFDPSDLLDDVTKEKYLWPLRTGISPEAAGVPPLVQLRASPSERLRLLKKLYGAGMLQPILPGSYAAGYENGMFAVNKDAERDRLVLDSRASNLLDPGQSVWSQAMASATSLASIYLDADSVLLASGEDLKDYFYQFRVSEERIRKNALCTKLSKAEAEWVFGRKFSDDECPVPMGLSTLAMGDICAVEFAQCSHLALCLRNDVMYENEVITLKGAVPRGLLHTGIIIDDLIVLEQMTKAAFEKLETGTSVGSRRTARARAAYVKANLPHNPKKGFVDEPLSRFWGIEIDGLKGILRASSLRMWPTCLITMRVCSLGLATVGLLEALAGSWVALLSVRRRLFSIMEVIFEPLGIEDQKAVVRLSPELKDELLSFVILGRLAMINLRARAADFVVATDASTEAIAAVKAPLCEPMVRELTRHCLRKGAWSKLLQPQAALQREKNLLDVEDELPADVFKSNPAVGCHC